MNELQAVIAIIIFSLVYAFSLYRLIIFLFGGNDLHCQNLKSIRIDKVQQ